MFVRRAVSIMLALLAGLLALQPRPGPAATGTAVLTVTRDVPPGHVLTGADVRIRDVPSDLVPAGALRDVRSVSGRMLSAAAHGGEILTDVRLVGPELTALVTGRDGQAAVPIRLADPDVAELLHPGRNVDIVRTSPESGGVSLLAEHVPVIASRPLGNERDRGRLVLVGLPPQQAAEVAAASVIDSLTVTLR